MLRREFFFFFTESLFVRKNLKKRGSGQCEEMLNLKQFQNCIFLSLQVFNNKIILQLQINIMNKILRQNILIY
jgi:hypothetical protein